MAELGAALVGNLYDTALDPSKWAGVLADLIDFVGGSAASVFAKDSVGRPLAIHQAAGDIDPHFVDSYVREYARLDPSTMAHHFAAIDRPMETVDLMPPGEFQETRFYREWVQPQEHIDFITTALEKTSSSVEMFGVFRHKRNGPLDDEARSRMRFIAPHIRRAFLVGRAVEAKASKTDVFADTLDAIASALFLVRADGTIVHANAAGTAMLDDRALLFSASGRLSFHRAESNRALADVLSDSDDGDPVVGAGGVALPLTARDGELHVAHVLPLASGARRRAGRSYSATVAIFIRKAEFAAASAPKAISRQFGLTPTELRVLLAIVDVGGVPEVSESLGIAGTTVKTHLGRVYDKTGTSRQADLVKLLSGYANPLIA